MKTKNKQNRRSAVVFLACLTVITLSSMVGAVAVVLSASNKETDNQPSATAQKDNNSHNSSFEKKSRYVAAKVAFRAMAKAMTEQQLVASTGAKNWCQLFQAAKNDSRLESLTINRLHQLSNEEASMDTWREITACTRYTDNELGQTAYQTALDELSWRVEENTDEVLHETYDDWEEIYRIAPAGSELERVALIQMYQTVQTFDDEWLYYYEV